MSKKVFLAILDGWGIEKNSEISAIAQAQTPNMDYFLEKFPNIKLHASGLAVGLPEGQMGNSEVGHTNLGAGRVVYQNLVKLNMVAKSGLFLKEKVIEDAFKYALDYEKNVHFIGLCSDGGVHSHIDHLKGLLVAAKTFGLQNVFLHAFTDGRDCNPTSGKWFLQDIKLFMKDQNIGKLASVVGRYYVMDRDKRWERVKKAYDLLVKGEGKFSENILETIQDSYNEGVTDEFLEPIVCVDKDKKPLTKIKEGDVVICFNFRTDRAREITEVLTQRDFLDFEMKKINLHYVTLTNYDKEFEGVKVVFDDEVLKNTLGEILQKNGKTQLRVAETEKYPHVTFFFSGGREEPFQGEERILCPSPKDVPTYDLKPEMSAYDIVKKTAPVIEKSEVDFICLNFANADMVGHTGDFSAAVKAVEAVDECVGKLANLAYENHYLVLILADHGNSDVMLNPDGSPNTQHSTNLVPCILMDKNHQWDFNANEGKLGDIAPTILQLMGIEIPEEMTGNILLSENKFV